MNRKKAYDVSNFPQAILDKIENIREDLTLSINGIEGDTLYEPTAKRANLPGEIEFSNENNSSIVLERDRTGSKESGYGGRGDTQCGAIDIVVGLGANKELYDSSGIKNEIDPDFIKDPARIYVSQKTDIDSAFNLANGTYGNSKTKSAIGMKADNIRIISREDVKIIAGIDEYNSQGANRRGFYGVDIIANNDDTDLQSIPKGENLVESLKTILKHVDDLAGIVETMIRNQMLINSVVMSHIHVTPSGPSSPAPEIAAVVIPGNAEIASKSYSGIIMHKFNSAIIKLNYLSQIGFKYINSKFNKVN